MAASIDNSLQPNSYQTFLRYALLNPTSLLEPLTESAIRLVKQDGEVSDKIELASALLAVIEELAHRSEDETRADGNQSDRKEHALVNINELLERLLTGVCIPSLQSSRPGDIHDRGRDTDFQLVHTMCELTLSCLGFRRDEMVAVRDILFMMCIKSLQTYCHSAKLSHIDRDKTLESGEDFHVFTSLELLNYFFEAAGKHIPTIVIPQVWSDKLFSEILRILNITRDKTVCSRVVGILLPKVLSHSINLLPDRLKLLWDQLSCDPNSEVGPDKSKAIVSATSGCHSNTFLTLCGMADFFFPAGGTLNADVIDLKSIDVFWNLVQIGLKHDDSMTRKRAMYLLNRVLDLCSKFNIEVMAHNSNDKDICPVFWWSAANSGNLQDIWADFILMVEALEETQVHVFKPLMPRLKGIIEATFPRETGRPYLHSSWLTVLFQRCFFHESKNTVVKWAVLEFLKLNFKQCPLLEQGNREFIYGSLLKVLHDSGVYSRIGQPEINMEAEGRSPVGTALLKFFKSSSQAFSDNSEKVCFLVDLLPAIQSYSGWGTVPMTYLCQSLANIPACKAWDWTSVKRVRDIIASLVTFPTHLRGALSCCLIETVLNLIDVSQVTLHQFAIVIGTVECLKRGSLLWQQLVGWFTIFGKDLKLEDGCSSLADGLYRSVCSCIDAQAPQGYSSAGVIDANHLAKILLLTAEAHFAAEENEGLLRGNLGDYPTPLHKMLYPIQDVVCRLHSHAYLPSSKADQTLKLLLAILNQITVDRKEELQKDTTTMVIIYIMEQCLEELLSYIMSKITMETDDLIHVSRLMVCFDLMEILSSLTHRGLFGIHSSVKQYLEDQVTKMAQLASRILAEEHKDNSMQSQIKKLTAISCLWCVIHHYNNTDTNDVCIPKDMKAVLASININQRFERPSGDINVSTQDLGKLVSTYEEKRWECVHFMVNVVQDSWTSHEKCEWLMEECISVLDIVYGSAILSIINCLEILIQQVLPANASICIDSMDITWRLVNDIQTDSGLYWLAYMAFIKMAFQNCVLAAPANSDISQKVHTIVLEICKIAEQKPGVLYFLISRYCQYVVTVIENEDCDVETDINHVDLLIQGCIYGPIQRRDHRTSQDSISILMKNSVNKPASEVARSVIKPDNCVRASMISTLLTVVSKKPKGMSTLAKRLCQDLLKKAMAVSEIRKHYLLNSYQHRIKQRIWQTILVLQPCFDKDTSEFMLKEVIGTLTSDCQLSIKNLKEWFVVLVLLKYPEFQSIIWQVIEKDAARTVNLMTSIISIITIMGPVIESKREKESFMHQALTLAMSFTMAGNFTVRLYAQAAFQRLWTSCEQQNLTELIDKYPGFQKCVEFMQNSRHTDRLKERLLGNFFYFKFDPLQDYSLETIFHTLPFLCNVIEEELISPDILQAELCSISSSEMDFIIPFRNERDDLKMCEPGTWKVRGPTHSSSSSESADVIVNTGDVQKKITPWTETLLSHDLDDIGSYGNRKGGKLILVTSLIDKRPNLGGLCRTSEIFGVGTFVLGNLQYAESHDFQSLSVTAEKWLQLQEVKPSDLRPYLLEMRKQGYTLVGVEQTANSTNITQYRFLEKTLLLLGNEKEGIPVDLIQLLDVCVEIPQLGIIRSLNVHVSGALLIWEYTRQQLL
ncbi:probable methyltransferase TARBP1 isoform X2 [Ptychodera flava]|uniref:probable methyltransferase TARBP1 isoform X2 n=1 Tax=Ptychodera flava TaxID=63121 RepID=UPI003969D899